MREEFYSELRKVAEDEESYSLEVNYRERYGRDKPYLKPYEASWHAGKSDITGNFKRRHGNKRLQFTEEEFTSFLTNLQFTDDEATEVTSYLKEHNYLTLFSQSGVTTSVVKDRTGMIDRINELVKGLRLESDSVGEGAIATERAIH
jgi:hypothetical protein